MAETYYRRLTKTDHSIPLARKDQIDMQTQDLKSHLPAQRIVPAGLLATGGMQYRSLGR